MKCRNELVDLKVTAVPDTGLLPLMSDEEIAHLRVYTPEQLRRRVVRPADWVWSDFPFVDCALPGAEKQLAPVIGFGLSEDRNVEPSIVNPHGFTQEWLRARAGNGMLTHRHADTQVYLVKAGTREVAVNRGSARMTVRLGPSDIFSVPPGAWRSLQCFDGDPGQVLPNTGGDSRTRIEWEPQVLLAAAERGWSRDANGYAAPTSVLALAAT